MIELRPYQLAAKRATYDAFRERTDNPLVVIPTGGGKTPLIASICADAYGWGERVLILAHVKELLSQAVDKLTSICPEVPYGIYSAGLKSRDVGYPVTIAGIQSVFRKARLLGPMGLVIIDECHLIPPEGEGMYRTFLEEARELNPDLRLLGLTATAFRTGTGPIATPEGLLNHIAYEIGVRELIVRGFLSPLISKHATFSPEVEGLHVRAGEFVAEEAEAVWTEDVVQEATAEVLRRAEGRNSVLIFCQGIDHAVRVAMLLPFSALITGTTPSEDRAETIQRFKTGHIRFLVNVNVLTTGFDAPNTDCVVLLRATASPGLYYQMVGRGFRLAPGKKDCLVLDFGGNIKRHGPVDQIKPRIKGVGDGPAPIKICPVCQSALRPGVGVCPDCGHVFPPRETGHDARPSQDGILSGQTNEKTLLVQDTYHSIHTKRDAPEGAPRTMRVSYSIGLNEQVSEWVCVEHQGFARAKAEKWWKSRSTLDCPDTAEEACRLAREGFLRPAKTITVREVAGKDWPEIVGVELSAPTMERQPGDEPDEPYLNTPGVQEDPSIPF